MKNERHRLESFQTGNWPHSFIDPKDLAKAGFFYLLNSDRVQCAFCRGVVCNWEQGDIPLMEHMRHYPRCEFLLEYNVGNVPIDEDPIRGRSGVRMGRDVCGNHHQHNRPPRITVHMDQDKKSKVYSMPMSLNLRELGVRPHQGAKTIQYISYESRLNSFAKWPHTATIKPERLADAGFFYIGKKSNNFLNLNGPLGIGDYVKCYYCDGEKTSKG
ncbi:putative inhibitor of apoptosis-like protein [Leptotrombidium deliense]|uniref:Putative inhibitor of apoptosis-like protein n=1 Tax=Leptotrombidium deliense TaxID=299467 RepID=A0A443SQ19_9ACAR|nr:putative inhibitor of apoptosis-like protein [Leptotrombidium deliense]